MHKYIITWVVTWFHFIPDAPVKVDYRGIQQGHYVTMKTLAKDTTFTDRAEAFKFYGRGQTMQQLDMKLYPPMRPVSHYHVISDLKIDSAQ